MLNPILLSLKTLPVWQDAWACRQTCFSWRFCWPSPPSNPNPGPHCSDSYPPPPSWLGSCQDQGCSSSRQMNYMNSVSNSPSSKVSHLWREHCQISERTFLLQVTFSLLKNFINGGRLHPLKTKRRLKRARDAWVPNRAGLLLEGDCRWPPSPTPLTLARSSNRNPLHPY